MLLLNTSFTLPPPIVLTHVPSIYGVGIQFYTQPSDDCSCGASKTVCPRSQPSAQNSASVA